MFIKPRPGLQVPDPSRGDHLPEAGRDVDASQYWQRRLNDGDVEAVTSVTPATKATSITTPSNSSNRKDS